MFLVMSHLRATVVVDVFHLRLLRHCALLLPAILVLAVLLLLLMMIFLLLLLLLLSFLRMFVPQPPQLS